MTTTVSGHHRVDVSADASDVWQAMRRFGDLNWAAGIEAVEVEGDGVGMLRKVRLAGSDEWICERLVARDDDRMSFSYVIEGDGMPGFNNYSAHVRAEPSASGCGIYWECQAEADDDPESAQQGLQALAAGIAGLFAAQFEPAGNA